jgi:hypothetical protein
MSIRILALSLDRTPALLMLIPRDIVDHRVIAAGRGVGYIFDYVDGEVSMLRRMFERRLRGYRAIGYACGEALRDLGGRSAKVVIEYDAEAVCAT